MERVQIVTVPTLPAPVTPPEPVPPDLALPPVIVITPDEAAYYKEVCDAYEERGANEDELRIRYRGLTRDDACSWAIYGFTVQDWLTLEVKMAEIAGYVESLRAQIEFLTELMEARQKVMDDHISALQEIGPLEQTVTPPAND